MKSCPSCSTTNLTSEGACTACGWSPTGAKKQAIVKVRNIVARALSDPRYRQRIVRARRGKGSYTREKPKLDEEPTT